MNRIRNFTAASVLVLGTSFAGIGVVGAWANGPTGTHAGSELDADIHSGVQAGDLAIANDVDTAAEVDVDNGEQEDVDVQENDAQDGETGSANDSTSSTEDVNTGSANDQAESTDTETP